MIKRPPNRTKAERWKEALAELRDIQAECEAYGAVPDGLRDEDREERYRAIADIDLSERESADF